MAAINPQTGEILVQGEDGAWVKPKMAQNPKTGEKLFLDGGEWKPVPGPQTSAGEKAARVAEFGARGLVDSALETIGAIPDMGTRAMRAMGLTDQAPDYYTQKLKGAVNSALKALPHPTVGGPQAPTGAIERGAYGAGRGAADAASIMVPAAIVGKTAKAGSATQAVAKTMASQPVMQTAAGMAGGSVGEATGNPYLGMAAALSVPAASAVAQSGLRAKTGLSKPAYKAIKSAIRADDLAAGRKNILAAGDDAMLVDAGPSVQGQLDLAMRSTGPGARVAGEAIAQRASAANSRITGALDDAFGKPLGIKSVETGLRSGTASARDAAYKAAYAKPINYGSEVGRKIETIVSSRVPPSAIKAANNLIRAEGKGVKQILANVSDDGVVTFKEMPSVGQIDYITRGLNDVAESEFGKGKLGGQSNLGRIYKDLSRELRTLARRAVPEYNTALKTAADPLAARSALLDGNKLLAANVTRDEAKQMMRGMTSTERAFMAQGVRSRIDDIVSNVRLAASDPQMDAREALKAATELSSRSAREKISMLIGPKASGKLFSDLDIATKSLTLKASLARNSMTYGRDAAKRAVDQYTAPGPLGLLFEGRPLEAGKAAVRAITRRSPAATQAKQEKIYTEMAQYLTGQRGAQAAQSLDYFFPKPGYLSALDRAYKAAGPSASISASRLKDRLTRQGLLD